VDDDLSVTFAVQGGFDVALSFFLSWGVFIFSSLNNKKFYHEVKRSARLRSVTEKMQEAAFYCYLKIINCNEAVGQILLSSLFSQKAGSYLMDSK
jgi:hypothetical protein